jgi:hypothetical protein
MKIRSRNLGQQRRRLLRSTRPVFVRDPNDIEITFVLRAFSNGRRRKDE